MVSSSSNAWGFVEDEIDEEGFNEYDDEETAEKKQAIQVTLPKRRKEIQDEAQAEIDRFNQSQEINPLLLINIVLKF